MITPFVYVWILALAAGPVVSCSRSWREVLQNDPIRFTVRLPLCRWDILPAMRDGYFRWVLPPLLVVEFERLPK